MITPWLTAAGTVIGMSSALLCAADEKIQMQDLLLAVQKAVQEQDEGRHTRRRCHRARRWQTLHEIETKTDGKTRDLLLDASGGVVEVEQELAIDSVPSAVKTAFETRGHVIKVEAVTKGKTVTYEAVVEKNGNKSEVAVGADRKTLKK
jgi:hypothetical protein